MRKISDYIFTDSWQLTDLPLKSYEDYVVLADVGDLKKGDVVKFVGFSDVDNHYGIFIFTNANNAVLEVPGDFSSPNGSALTTLTSALAKA